MMTTEDDLDYDRSDDDDDDEMMMMIPPMSQLTVC